MSFSKSAVATFLVVITTAAGCKGWPFRSAKPEAATYFDHQPTFPAPTSQSAIVEAAAVDGPSEIDTFTIRFRMVEAQVPPLGTTPLNERVSAWQTATITTNVAKDGDGLFETSIEGGGGRPNQLVVHDPVRLGPQKMSVRFRTLDTLESGLNWSFTVTVDGAYAEPRYEIVGKWSGAHAAELDINGVQVYRQAAKIEPPADPVIPPPVNFVLDDPRVRNINDEASQANGVRSNWTAAGTRWGNTPEPPRVPVRSMMSTNFRAHGKLQKPANCL